MNKIVGFMNWLTDMDTGWWPLLKYRPEKHEHIDSSVVCKITPFFGTATGFIIIYISNNFNDPKSIAICLAAGWVIFFIGYRFSFSVAWNIRADNLKNSKGPT